MGYVAERVPIRTGARSLLLGDMGKRAPKNEETQEAKGKVVEELEETTVVEEVQLIHKHYLKGGTTDGSRIVTIVHHLSINSHRPS